MHCKDTQRRPGLRYLDLHFEPLYCKPTVFTKYSGVAWFGGPCKRRMVAQQRWDSQNGTHGEKDRRQSLLRKGKSRPSLSPALQH